MSPSCSYCGSITPEAFFAAIDDGSEIGPTDKTYKVYLEVANDDPTAMRVGGGSNAQENHPQWGTAGGGYWKREGELSEDERRLALACGWGVDRDPEGRKNWWINFGPVGEKRYGKFYFQHLDSEGRQHFLEIVNEDRINFGPPGYLYVTPFFARKESR